MRIVAIVNQKGGCGKTTSALTLAALSARRGHRTLLVDLDPQSHCALGLAVPDAGIERTVGDAMLAPQPPAPEEIVWTAARRLDLAPSTTRLAALEAARGGLAAMPDRDVRLARVLRAWADRYDWCFIDCPPSIGLLTFNALRAAGTALIPIESGYFALRGAEKQVAALRALVRRVGSGASHHVFVTMHREGSALSHDLIDEVRERFGDRLVPTPVRFDERLKEAVSLGVPVFEHDPESDAAADYTALGDWLEANAPEPIRAGACEVVVRPVEPASDPGAAPESPEAPGPPEPPLVAGEPGDGAFQPVAPASPTPVALPSRAAELAARTEAILARNAEMRRRAEADGRVARIVREIEGNETEEERREAERVRPGDLARLYGAHVTRRGVLFVFPAGPDAEVCLACEANGWSASAHRLSYNASIAAHEARVPLPPGDHAYRLVVNGQWMSDPHNPRTRPNPFGQLDSMIEVVEASGSAITPERNERAE